MSFDIQHRAIRISRLNIDFESIKQFGWLLLAIFITSVLNYFSNIYVGRILGPADYGIFIAMGSLSIIILVLANVVQTVATNYVSVYRSKGDTDYVGGFCVFMHKRLLVWGIGIAAVLTLFSFPLASFLNLPSATPIIIISMFAIPTALLPVVYGVQRGMQRFGALGVTQISSAVFRFVAVIGFLALGTGVAGAVISFPISALGAWVVGILFLVDLLRLRSNHSYSMEGMLKYSFNAMLALTCFAILSNSDIILVKNRFSPIEAGIYSAIATLGKTGFWLSSAVVVILLPKATERYARGESAKGLLVQSLLVVAVLCVSVTIIFYLFSRLIVNIVFGSNYLMGAHILGLYGLAMTIQGLVYVMIIYFLAVKERRYILFLLAGSILQIILFLILPLNLAMVPVVLIGIGIFLLVGGVCVI